MPWTGNGSARAGDGHACRNRHTAGWHDGQPHSPAARPRRWRGALLPDNAKVTIKCLDYEKRPVSAMADNFEILNVTEVDIEQDKSTELKILFDADHNLDERILNEQFVN